MVQEEGMGNRMGMEGSHARIEGQKQISEFVGYYPRTAKDP